MLKNQSLKDFSCVDHEELFTELTPAEGATISAGFATGVWTGNDGGTYYLRRDGNELWWFGEGPGAGGFSNVFQGTIFGDRISGKYIDVPKLKTQGKGSLELRQIDSKTFEVTKAIGGFGGTKFTLLSPGF